MDTSSSRPQSPGTDSVQPQARRMLRETGWAMATDREITGVLSEFARTLVTDFPIQGILDHLVKRIVEIMPVTGAGVTLIAGDAPPRYVAASNAVALSYEKLQTELGDGPCLAAFRSGEAISVPDVDDDYRFPIFSRRAARMGMGAVFTFPLRGGEERQGALDLYRDAPGELDGPTMEVAQTLADVAAAYVMNAQARADLRDASDRFREDSLHDPLTRLPNRTLLSQRLEHAVLRTRRTGAKLAILFVDMDRFKDVNDTHGHRVGDELLVEIAARLTGLLRSGDTLARISGDEFVILCEDLVGPSVAEDLATRIGAALAEPFPLTHHELKMTASVGIAFSGPGIDVPDQILQDADIAMYQAKGKGGAGHQIYDLREHALAKHQVESMRDLRGALSRGELWTAYQPIVRTHDGTMVGAEALLRWSSPTSGLVDPVTLVSLAERSGLIGDIGRWVLEQACRDRKQWGAAGRAEELSVSVNVSARQLMSPDFAATVAEVLEDTDTDPRVVTLEVTETVLVEDVDRAFLVLEDLRRMGLSIALDDFGTGYSSLWYLRRFPVDVVKIDSGFVAELGDPTARTIVSAVVDLAHVLGMGVVAEGVETIEQHATVAGMGCNSCQGFLFARPMPVDELTALVHRTPIGAPLQLPRSIVA
jgi:diguanylate cyclase (GGDEF)-like protein